MVVAGQPTLARPVSSTPTLPRPCREVYRLGVGANIDPAHLRRISPNDPTHGSTTGQRRPLDDEQAPTAAHDHARAAVGTSERELPARVPRPVAGEEHDHDTGGEQPDTERELGVARAGEGQWLPCNCGRWGLRCWRSRRHGRIRGHWLAVERTWPALADDPVAM
jgi:hypothetical protein